MPTCQICGRQIKLKGNVLAAHGYRRPVSGWQTASCEGARHLAMEESTTVLESHIKRCIDAAQTMRGRLKFADDEELAIENPLKGHYVGRTRIYEKIRFTKATYDEVRGQNQGVFMMRSIRSWEDVVEREERIRQRELNEHLAYIEMQQKRLADWRATH